MVDIRPSLWEKMKRIEQLENIHKYQDGGLSENEAIEYLRLCKSTGTSPNPEIYDVWGLNQAREDSE